MSPPDLRSGRSDVHSAQERYPALAAQLDAARSWLDQQRWPLLLGPAASEALLMALGERLAATAGALFDLATPPNTASAFEQSSARLPELQRLLAVIDAQFRAFTSELLQRVSADADALAQLLAAPPLRELTAIRLGLSDPHGGGRSVVVLEFDPLWRVVYKPKDLRIAARFFALCSQLSGQLPLPLHVRPLLLRDGYGYESFVAAEACADEGELERYYLRAGSYLRLLEVLGGRDFHAENVTAAGPHPVLLDLETVISASGLPSPRVTAEQRAWQIRADSLLATGFVPDWESGPGGAIDHSGLAIRPSLAGQPAPVDRARHLDAVIDGYLRTAAALRDAALERVLRAEPALVVRHIERPTPFYTALLQRSLSLELLASSAARSAFLRTALGDGPLVEQELAALERLDVPLFTVELGSSNVRELGASESLDVLPADPFNAIAVRAARAPTPELIESAFATGPLRRLNAYHPVRPADGHVQPTAEAQTAVPAADASDAALVRAALEIGEMILASAIEASGPALSWLGLVYVPALDGRLLHRLPPDLQSGTAGLAIVLARMFAVSGDARYADCARRALQQTLRRLEVALHGPERVALDADGRTELASRLYAVRECAGLLADPALLERARAHERKVPDASIDGVVERVQTYASFDRLDAIERAVLLDERERARLLAGELLAARAASGHFMPRGLGADQHNLSALSGVPAIADLCLRIAFPNRFGSLRSLQLSRSDWHS